MVTTQERNRITPGVGAALAAFFFFLGVVAASQFYLGSTGPIVRGAAPAIESRDTIDSTTLFSQSRPVSRSESFRHAEVAVLFGDCELDLRHAGLASGGARVETLAAFGRVHVMVPDDWSIERGDELILGSYVNHPGGGAPDPKKVLRIEGVVLGGELEVSH
jgi:Cell wall-active antibiotics response 4TMS YvqF